MSKYFLAVFLFLALIITGFTKVGEVSAQHTTSEALDPVSVSSTTTPLKTCEIIYVGEKYVGCTVIVNGNTKNGVSYLPHACSLQDCLFCECPK